MRSLACMIPSITIDRYTKVVRIEILGGIVFGLIESDRRIMVLSYF